MKRFVYWHTYLVVHSQAVMKAMARSGVETVWVANQAMIDDRKGYWSAPPELPGIEVAVSPDKTQIAKIMDRMPEDTVHLFQGFRGMELVETALPMAKARKLKIGVFSENRPAQGRWTRSKFAKSPISAATLRRFGYKLQAQRSKRGVKFVLVAGYDGAWGGRNFFRNAGFEDSLLYPFGYWMDAPDTFSFLPRQGEDFHLLYAASCIPRKGGDVMIDALGKLKGKRWRLSLVGDGPERQGWEAKVAELGIGSQVEFLGSVAMERTLSLMSEADAFVLPSQFDGWGMVTIESMTRGTPVICTDHCGSSDLVHQPWRGSIVPSNDATALAEAVDAWISHGRNTQEKARRIWEWSKTVNGDPQAQYLKAVAKSEFEGAERPEAFWLNS